MIDRTEIAKHREISKSVREDKIGPYIEDAQRLDLKPLLGERLYNAISKAPLDHALLLDGGEYTYNGETYDHPGLKKVLSIFAYARYVMFGSYTDTAFGFVEKSNQDSKPVGDAHKRTLYTQNQNTATAYFEEVVLFMNRKEYALWRSSGCTPRRSGFNISKIN
ncbi:DUF6712 family protein [Salinimicrobium sediminis]|uniref:DUF6712 family protein n=1 Tax=Salinimicrobium sediminis TaxID=1343891 RepID=UPI00117B5C3A|nr:hypothetical protein [Salinimicrobium sediminis]